MQGLCVEFAHCCTQVVELYVVLYVLPAVPELLCSDHPSRSARHCQGQRGHWCDQVTDPPTVDNQKVGPQHLLATVKNFLTIAFCLSVYLCMQDGSCFNRWPEGHLECPCRSGQTQATQRHWPCCHC